MSNPTKWSAPAENAVHSMAHSMANATWTDLCECSKRIISHLNRILLFSYYTAEYARRVLYARACPIPTVLCSPIYTQSVYLKFHITVCSDGAWVPDDEWARNRKAINWIIATILSLTPSLIMAALHFIGSHSWFIFASANRVPLIAFSRSAEGWGA